MSKGKPAWANPTIRTMHMHATPPVTCPNCGYSSQGYTTTASTGQAGSHTHGLPHVANVLDQKVVDEFAKPDPDPALSEWRRQHIG